jgi:hypothetical protein
MSKMSSKVWVLSVLLGGLACLGAATDSVAQIRIDIGTPDLHISIGSPSPVVIHSPPAMVVIPGTYVYLVADIESDILFYHGYWYRPHRGHWFKAASYNGPWVRAVRSKVPRAILHLPPGYRKIPPGHHRIPYKHVKGNWNRWEREKHWHRNKYWRRDYRGGHEKVRRDYRGGHEKVVEEYKKNERHGKRGRD